MTLTGRSVHVPVPAMPGPTQPMSADLATGLTATRATRAIVFDERLLFAEAFADSLRSAGVEAVATASLADALATSVGQVFDLVVANVRLHPSGSPEAFRSLRRAFPEARLVCL